MTVRALVVSDGSASNSSLSQRLDNVANRFRFSTQQSADQAGFPADSSSEKGFMNTDYYLDIGLTKDLMGSERAQWGLASLLIGAVLILAALMTLIFNVLLWQSGPRGMPRMAALIGTVIGLAAVLGLAGFGIVAGLKGRSRTPLNSPPSPLATAGVVTGSTALVLWLLIGFDLLLILAPFIF
jgi:hypothetical protein